MKAIVLHEVKSKLALEDRDELSPVAGQVVVTLQAAAFNRRDYWITQGKYPGIELPVVPGSDGAGVVSKLGTGVSDEWLNRQVVINPGWNWGSNQQFQSNDFQILGMPIDGTFAGQVLVPIEYLHASPGHLSPVKAAALPLAGVTAFRALFSQAGLKAGENVLVTGAGGGVATFAIQFAKAAGAKIYVTSSSPEKISNAIRLGATAGFNYRESDWGKQLVATAGNMNVIVDSAGGQNYAVLLNVAAPGGRVVNYGATTGPAESLNLFHVFWKQLRLLGSTMGSPEDFSAMLDFVTQHKIEPVIDQVYPLADANEALDRLSASEQFGNLVLEM